MIQPKVQKYLETHSLHELFEAHGVKGTLFGHKAILNYDQINARKNDSLASECRGLILSTPDGSEFPYDVPVGETKLLAWPFCRFFNWQEGTVDKVDLVAATVIEKVDGSLLILYWDPFKEHDFNEMGRWCVATRNNAEGNNSTNGWGLTILEQFKKALQGGFRSTSLLTGETYMFELCGPDNQVVVQHDKHHLYFLGARNRDGEELSNQNGMLDQMVNIFQKDGMKGVKRPPTHNFSNMNELHEFVQSRPGKENEGVVLVDYTTRKPNGSFPRMKIKSDAYMMANHVNQSMDDSAKVKSPRTALRVLLNGQADDLRSILQEKHIEYIDRLETGIAALIDHYNKVIDQMNADEKLEEEKKGFAHESRKFRFQWAEKYMHKNKNAWKSPLHHGALHGHLEDFIEKAKKGPKGKEQWSDGFLDDIANHALNMIQD